MQYVEHTVHEPLIDSDRESSKSEDNDVVKEQQMCIWNRKYEVRTVSLLLMLSLPRVRMREAGLSNGFCPQVCQCVSQSSKIWADHDNEGSKHFSTSLKQWK